MTSVVLLLVLLEHLGVCACMHAWYAVTTVHVLQACWPVKWVVSAVWQGSLAGFAEQSCCHTGSSSEERCQGTASEDC